MLVLAEHQHGAPRKLLHELAADAPAVIFLFAMPHPNLDRGQGLRKIGGPYDEELANFELARYGKAQAAPGAVQDHSLERISGNHGIRENHRRGLAAPPGRGPLVFATVRPGSVRR